MYFFLSWDHTNTLLDQTILYSPFTRKKHGLPTDFTFMVSFSTENKTLKHNKGDERATEITSW